MRSMPKCLGRCANIPRKLRSIMEFETLNQLLAEAVKAYRKDDALLYKKDGAWHKTSSGWLTRARHLALGFLPSASSTGPRRALGIATSGSSSTPRFNLGAPNVPVCTLTSRQTAYILKDSGSKAVVVSDSTRRKEARGGPRRAPSLEHVITLDRDGDRGPRSRRSRLGKEGGGEVRRRREAASAVSRRPGEPRLYVGDHR
jgi:long-subunit acyl-CoA synthetase (AMP-forming)